MKYVVLKKACMLLRSVRAENGCPWEASPLSGGCHGGSAEGAVWDRDRDWGDLDPLLVLLLVTPLKAAVFTAVAQPTEVTCSLARQSPKCRRQISKVVLPHCCPEICVSVCKIKDSSGGFFSNSWTRFSNWKMRRDF